MTPVSEATTAPFEAPSLADLPRVRHGFFSRRGGVSQGIYASLNCGLGSGDAAEHVRENRARAAESLDLKSERLVTAYQVHGDRVVHVREPWGPDDRPKADALITDRPGIGLGILTADCAPVLAADAEASIVGAAHAGWRGALAGVTDALIAGMVGLGARPERLRAVVGPCISQANYEVGPELESAFRAADPENAAFFRPGHRPDRFRFDLQAYVAGRLTRAEIGEVAALPYCTYARDDLFFSFRRATHRGEPDYGRALSVIALAPEPGLA